MALTNYMLNVDSEVADIDAQIAALQARRKDVLRRTTVRCQYCKRWSWIASLVFIQTYWYESPYGCTGGDSWILGEGQFECPKCSRRNRLIDIFIGDEAAKLTKLRRYFKNIVDSYDRRP